MFTGFYRVYESIMEDGGIDEIAIPIIGITRSSIVRVCVVYAAIMADIFVTAYTDPLQTTEVLTHILLLGLQIFLVLVIMLAFFLLTTSLSLHVQLGLYDKYLRQHRGVFSLSLLTVLLVASMGAYRLALVYQNTPYLLMWQQPGYLAVWMIQRSCLLALHCTTAYATAISFKGPQENWLLSMSKAVPFFGATNACITVAYGVNLSEWFVSYLASTKSTAATVSLILTGAVLGWVVNQPLEWSRTLYEFRWH